MKPLNKALSCLLISLIAFSLTTCQRNNETWDEIQRRGELVVGLDPTYPPFELGAGVELHGLDIDLIQAIADQWHVDVRFVYFGYDGLYDALTTKQVDLLISALVIQPSRAKEVAHSDPYFNAGQVLLRPAGSTDINSMADLANRSVAVELGAAGHVTAIEMEKQLANLVIVPFNSPIEALTAAAAGEVDAVLIDSVSGRQFLGQDSNLIMVAEPVTAEPYVIVVRVDDDKLLREVNAALEQLDDEGELERIARRWLEEATP